VSDTTPNQEQQERRYRPKIYRCDAKGKVLDCQDFVLHEVDDKGNLDEGKIVFNYTEYDVNTHKANITLKHYMDVETARVVFSDILNLRFRKDPNKEGFYLPIVDEYKGGRGGAAGHPEWEWASRHLIINYTDQLRIGPAITFNFTLCEGTAGPTGAIMPKTSDAPYKGSIAIPLQTMDRGRVTSTAGPARKMAATILDYINCMQTAAMIKDMLSESTAFSQMENAQAA